MDKITLLKAMPGVLLAKRWTTDGIAGYDKARYVYVREADVSCIYSLATVLEGVEMQSNVCAIRGMKVSLEDAQAMGKLPDLAGGEALPAVKQSGRSYAYLRRKGIFHDVPHHWVCLDVDKFKPVKTAGDLLTAPENCVAEFIEQLPAAWQTATCYWQLSNSAGAPGNEGTLKVHLWFWLSVARTGAELLAYADATGMSAMVDVTLFRAVQVHYTAAPVVDAGVVCPVVQRHGRLPGLMGDEVDLAVTPEMLARVKVDREGSAGAGLWDEGDAPVDPGSKPGLVGAFCRSFPTLADVMAQEWADDLGYSPDGGSDRRWTWGGGGGAVGGAWVVDGPAGGQWVGNSHATSPFGERLVNLYDLVRCHKYGHLDSAVSAEDSWTIETDVKSRPSEAAMRAWCRSLPEVRAELDAAEAEAERVAMDAERIAEAETAAALLEAETPIAENLGKPKLDVWGTRMLKKLRGVLHVNGLTDAEIDACIDEAALTRTWAGTFYAPEKNKIFLLNRAGDLIQHPAQEGARALTEAYGPSIVPAGINAAASRLAGEAATQTSIAAQAKALREVAWGAVLAKVRDYRQRSALHMEVDIFASKPTITIQEHSARVVYTHSPFIVPKSLLGEALDAAILDEYKEHLPWFDRILDLVLHARFATDRRKAFLWLQLLSSGGKGFLLDGVLGRDGLGIVTEISTREIEAAFEGKPVGLDAAMLIKAWVIWVDELKAVKAEIKQINNRIMLAPKNQLRVIIDVFAKIFTSAETVDSLVSSAGVEAQFAERFSAIHNPPVEGVTGRMDSLPLFAKVGKLAYRTVITAYAAQRMNAEVERMRALGRGGSAKSADAWLDTWHDETGIAIQHGHLDDSLPEFAAEIKDLIIKQAKIKLATAPESWESTPSLGKLNPALAGALDYCVDVVVGSRTRWGKDENLAVVRNPMYVVNTWVAHTRSRAEQAMIGKKNTLIADLISGEKIGCTPRYYKTVEGDKKEVKGRVVILSLDVALPAAGSNVVQFIK